jgi:hypothetical protein
MEHHKVGVFLWYKCRQIYDKFVSEGMLEKDKLPSNIASVAEYVIVE